MPPDVHEAKTDEAANAEAAHREACDYWGYLIKPDKCGTELFDRLLKGIADVISKEFEPSESPDLTPTQLASFYRAVGGDYDVLFIGTHVSAISFIYRSLGAFHSLQPAPNDDGYSTPSIPALKKKGFVTWQTIQLLLGPEEQVPFLQNAVAQFDVVDPATNLLFPKLLPKECFPDRPDDTMESWYENVAARLKRDAEEDTSAAGRNGERVDDSAPRMSSEMSGEGSADERHGAARYFEDPLYRKTARPRPTYVRHVSKPTRPHPEDRGRLISNVRHMLNPFSRKKSVPPERYEDDSYSDDDGATPVPAASPPAPRYAAHPPTHKRPRPPRRASSLSTTDSNSDSDHPPSSRRTPVMRQHRSPDPAVSPREYFSPHHYEDRRYSHDISPGSGGRKPDVPPPVYGPTKSPLFATHVAQMQAHYPYDGRPGMPTRTSYRPHHAGVRYAPQAPLDPRDADLPYSRERGRDHERDRSRRRRSEEHARDHNRHDSVRTRSHDYFKDDWNERDRAREKERGRDRDRDRRGTHRYVAGIEGGVGGRRYPVDQPWR